MQIGWPIGLLMSIALGPIASAQLIIFEGSSVDESAWQDAVGSNTPMETFEGYTGTPDFEPTGDPIAALPQLGVTLETDAPDIFPGVFADIDSAHSGENQLSNFAAGGQQGASIRVRAMPGKSIRAVGFWQCDPLSDQRLFAYAFNGFILGSVTAQVNDGSGNSFAGFVSSHPVAYVRLEGNFADGYVQIDDLQIVVEDICPADLAVDGQLDFYDVQEFLSRFAVGDPRADLTEDGIIDFFDILTYLQIYSDGCP